MNSFDWRSLFLGDHPWSFLLQIVFRTVVMYTILFLFFKVTGKKGIKQLTVFDLILIIALGSAGGDPMFMEEVPLLHAITVFIVILGIYIAINKLTQRSHKLDEALQGKAARLITEGVIDIKELHRENLTTLELFAELRQKSVSQLGQIKRAYLESTGEISVFYFEDEDVKSGLPLYPETLESHEQVVREKGAYSCIQCGYTKEYEEATAATDCPECKCNKLVKSLDEERVA